MSSKNNKKTVQKSIPYNYCYKDGIIETKQGHFTRAYELKDINFAIAPYEEMVNMYKAFEELLNIFPSSMRFQIFIQNHKADRKETMKNVHYPLSRSDKLNNFRIEIDNILADRISRGKNSIKQKKYLIISTKDNDSAHAKQVLRGYDADISRAISRISKDVVTTPCRLEERLESIFNVYNQEPDAVFGNDIDEEGNNYLDMNQVVRTGLTTKDVIAPSGMLFESNRFMVGETYGRSMFLSYIPGRFSTEFITDLTNLNIEMVISIYHKPIDPQKARKMVRDQLRNIKGEISAAQKHANREGYSWDILPEDLENSYEKTKDLMNDIVERDQNIFEMTFVVTVFADTMHELDNSCSQVINLAKAKRATIRTLLFQQEEGLNASLPLCVNDLSVNRLLTAESCAIFIPYTSQELFQKNGIYYGVNQITNNIIVANRLAGQNYNGLFIGNPGSGKSFLAKQEMLQALLRSERNYVYVIDPQGEYGGALKDAFNGEEIILSAGSTSHLNPLDMDVEYEGGDNPLSVKCDYIIGMIENLVGNQELTPKARSIIARCTEKIYSGYFKHINDMRMRGEYITFDRDAMPTLSNLHAELLRQEEPEAHEIATAIEIYAVGAFATFSHRSNVDTSKRYVTYNIKNLGTGLKALGLYVCLNDIWNKMIDNYRRGYWTWIYIDEFWYLLQTDASCQFVSQVWRTARKWNGVPTGITQNTDDMLMYQSARTIFNNTSFVAMLNSSKNDQDALAEILRIPESQLTYISNNPEGMGLLYTGSTILPFDNTYPKNSMLYKVASTSKAKDRGF